MPWHGGLAQITMLRLSVLLLNPKVGEEHGAMPMPETLFCSRSLVDAPGSNFRPKWVGVGNFYRVKVRLTGPFLAY